MWQEFFNYGYINALAAGVGAVFTANAPPVHIDSNSDFLWIKSLFGATNAQIRVQFQDNRLGRQLTTLPVALRMVASAFCGAPFILPPPYYLLKGGSNFAINASDASGAANNLRFVMQGAKLRTGIAPWEQAPGEWRTFRRKEPFVYNSGLLALGAGGTLSFPITVENDAPFLVQKMTGEHNGAVGAVLVEIQDSTSIENNWMNMPLPFETIFGTGQFPNIMYSWRLVGDGKSPSAITVNLQNLTAAAIVVEIAFTGLKLFQ